MKLRGKQFNHEMVFGGEYNLLLHMQQKVVQDNRANARTRFLGHFGARRIPRLWSKLVDEFRLMVGCLRPDGFQQRFDTGGDARRIRRRIVRRYFQVRQAEFLLDQLADVE